MSREKGAVAFVTTSLIRGGAQKQLAEVAIRLKEREWRVAGVISLTAGGEWEAILREQGIDVYSLGMGSSFSIPGAVARATWLLRDLAPDVVVGFLFHGTMLGSVAARMAGVPRVVASVRSERMGGRWRELAFARSAGLWDTALVNSRSVGESLTGEGILYPDAWDIIPNGIGQLAMPTEASVGRDALGVADSHFLWLAVGSLLPAKDYPTLLEALANLEGERWRVLVAGGGPLSEPLRERAAQLGLLDRVRFLGERSDVPNLLRIADGFVNSSLWEGSPNAVLEAMMMSLPVVATEVGGTPELLSSPEQGLLVPAGSPERLAGAMARIMNMHGEERARMGRAGREAVISNHAWDRVVARWERVLAPSHTRSSLVPEVGAQERYRGWALDRAGSPSGRVTSGDPNAE